jgi:hypothetical protein
MGIGQDLLNVPMGEMIYSMASSIAKSQMELDNASIEVAEMMGGLKTIHDPDTGAVSFTDSRVFFGHEYMTVAEAMVTQGEGNPAVTALIGAQTLAYDKYKPGTATAYETSGTIGNYKTQTSEPLTPETLKTYRESKQAMINRIGFHQSNRAAELLKTSPDPAVLTSIDTAITELRKMDAANAAKVAGIFERQIQIPSRVSLLELGFAPVFYAFVDTIIEVKISITISQSSESTVSTTTDSKASAINIGFRFSPLGRGRAAASRTVSTSQVNGTYSNRYSYTAEGSSLLRTKLTPLPPPAILEERIRAMMTADQARKAAELGLLTQAAATA